MPDKSKERSMVAAVAIVESLPVGLAIDSQTLMQRAARSSDHFDAQDATVLEARLKTLHGIRIIDAGQDGYEQNIHFWVHRPM